MSLCLVIPDAHLKPQIFDRADAILESGQADRAIQIGDLVDDWGQINNVGLYNQTMKRAYDFHKTHPDTLWVMGNHDYDYVCSLPGSISSGHSRLAEIDVSEWMAELVDIGAAPQVIHIVDNILFTHAGLTESWIDYMAHKYMDGRPAAGSLEKLANYAAPIDLFMENSPLWARPQLRPEEKAYSYRNCLQVVGHTPVEAVNLGGNILSTDVFSTYRDGTPFGDQTFAIVDTVTKEWRLAEEG